MSGQPKKGKRGGDVERGQDGTGLTGYEQNDPAPPRT